MASKKKRAKKTAQQQKPTAEPSGKQMGRPVRLRGPLGELAEAFGGTTKLALQIGIEGRRTINRWESGAVIPSRPMRILLAQLAEGNGIAAPYGIGAVCPRPAWLDLPREGHSEDVLVDEDE